MVTLRDDDTVPVSTPSALVILPFVTKKRAGRFRLVTTPSG
jgi:hypothetical protein